MDWHFRCMFSGPGFRGWAAGSILRQAVTCLPACLRGHRDPPPPARIPGAEKPGGLRSPKSEACAYFWQLRILYCRVTSQARNLHQKAKKNTSKNKHESQDFVPGTPATHILLAAPLASLLAVWILLNRAEACFHEWDLRVCARVSLRCPHAFP